MAAIKCIFFVIVCMNLIQIKFVLSENSDDCGVIMKRNESSVDDGELDRFDHPWKAALVKTESDGSKGEYFCGGVLIDSDTIITAAHCVTSPINDETLGNSNFVVVLGAYNLSKASEVGRTLHGVASISLNGKWKSTIAESSGDIAVIKLTNPVDFNNYIMPACVPDSELTSTHGIASGWKIPSANKSFTSNLPRKIELSISNKTKCLTENPELLLLEKITDDMFCAEGNVVCKDDLGSGLYVEKDGKFYVAGLVSSSNVNDCGNSKVGLYSDIYKMSDFIEQEQKKNQVEVPYKWIAGTFYKSLPENALRFYTHWEMKINNFYVGRMKKKDHRGFRACILLTKPHSRILNNDSDYPDFESEPKKFDLLTGKDFEWKREESECLVELQKGQYVGRHYISTFLGSGWVVGTIVPSESTIYVPSADGLFESSYKDYEYLHYKC